jgi:hypothetical protein
MSKTTKNRETCSHLGYAELLSNATTAAAQTRTVLCSLTRVPFEPTDARRGVPFWSDTPTADVKTCSSHCIAIEEA